MYGLTLHWTASLVIFTVLRIGQSQLMSTRTIVLVVRAEVFDNPAYINSSVKTSSRKPTQAGFLHSYEADLLVPLEQIRMNAEFLLLMNGRFEVPIYNRTFDLCAFLKRPTDRLIKMIFDEVQRHGNIPTRCPVAPGPYYFRNCTFGKLQPPSFLPEGQYQFKMKFIADQLVIHEHHWFGRLKKL